MRSACGTVRACKRGLRSGSRIRHVIPAQAGIQLVLPAIQFLFPSLRLAGGSPAATHFSCLAKKSKQKKATPKQSAPCGGSRRAGGPGGIAANSLRSNMRRSFSARPTVSSALRPWGFNVNSNPNVKSNSNQCSGHEGSVRLCLCLCRCL